VRRLLRFLALVAAIGYPLALLAVVCGLRFVGERWWVSQAALYLPRLGFALPLPFVALAIWLWAPRRWLWLQLVSVVLLLFPLMGLRAGGALIVPRASGEVIRLVTFNVFVDRRQGYGPVLEQVRRFNPSLVLMQEVTPESAAELLAGFPGWHTDFSDQFLIASRFPITEVRRPSLLEYPRGTGGAHFMRYTLQLPGGPLALFQVHTSSPRDALEALRGGGLRSQLRSGALFGEATRAAMEWNGERRRRQIEALARAAAGSPLPVLIAGDTNLPGLSWVLNHYLGAYQDAFEVAGSGFGYTFPATRRAWMRIDRVLGDRSIWFQETAVGRMQASDHYCVFAAFTVRR